jgi:hypothetical protein
LLAAPPVMPPNSSTLPAGSVARLGQTMVGGCVVVGTVRHKPPVSSHVAVFCWLVAPTPNLKRL